MVTTSRPKTLAATNQSVVVRERVHRVAVAAWMHGYKRKYLREIVLMTHDFPISKLGIMSNGNSEVGRVRLRFRLNERAEKRGASNQTCPERDWRESDLPVPLQRAFIHKIWERSVKSLKE
jgi:hypothetical protein